MILDIFSKFSPVTSREIHFKLEDSCDFDFIASADRFSAFLHVRNGALSYANVGQARVVVRTADVTNILNVPINVIRISTR